MIYANIGGIRDSVNENLALEFYRNQNKDIGILTEIYTNHDQIHHILNQVGARRWKILQNYFQSTYFKNRICKIKKYLNYILMIINQNILAILKTFLNLQKSFIKNFAPRRILPKLHLLNFLANFLTERKCLMNHLKFVRQKYIQMRP